jgi:hypothetical protein
MERENKDVFMGCRFRPIIGGNGNPSRGKCRFRRKRKLLYYFSRGLSYTI